VALGRAYFRDKVPSHHAVPDEVADLGPVDADDVAPLGHDRSPAAAARLRQRLGRRPEKGDRGRAPQDIDVVDSCSVSSSSVFVLGGDDFCRGGAPGAVDEARLDEVVFVFGEERKRERKKVERGFRVSCAASSLVRFAIRASALFFFPSLSSSPPLSNSPVPFDFMGSEQCDSRAYTSTRWCPELSPLVRAEPSGSETVMASSREV